MIFKEFVTLKHFRMQNNFETFLWKYKRHVLPRFSRTKFDWNQRHTCVRHVFHKILYRASTLSVCINLCSRSSWDTIIVCCDIAMKPSGPLKLISLSSSLSLSAERSVDRASGRTAHWSTASAFRPSPGITHIPWFLWPSTLTHTQPAFHSANPTLPFRSPAAVSCRPSGDETTATFWGHDCNLRFCQTTLEEIQGSCLRVSLKGRLNLFMFKTF